MAIVLNYGHTTDGVIVKTGRAAIPRGRERGKVNTPTAPAEAAAPAAAPSKGITAILRIPR